MIILTMYAPPLRGCDYCGATAEQPCADGCPNGSLLDDLDLT